MGRTLQNSFLKTNWKYRFAAGGTLRTKRQGRFQRPLSTKEPLHLVFKARQDRIKSRTFRSHRNFKLIQSILKVYAKRFHIKLEQISIQSNHIHLVIRTSRRSHFHFFFRVVAGQIAQRFAQEGLLRGTDTPAPTPTAAMIGSNTPAVSDKLSLWQYRPFTRVVRGRKAFRIVMDYVRLNEKEARGELRYQPRRLRGLSLGEWALLWI